MTIVCESKPHDNVILVPTGWAGHPEPEALALASLIVSALNNHAELLARCKGMVVWLEQAHPQAVILSREECLIELRQAIEQAEAQ
jgi:hypothetical protein